MIKLTLAFLILILNFNTIKSSNYIQEDNYTLEIEKLKKSKLKNIENWLIKATLKNNTNDTLRYCSMSCSWTDYYSLNNTNFKIIENPCDKNIPIIITIAPKESKSVEIQLSKKDEKKSIQKNFKIILNLIIVKSSNNRFENENENKTLSKNLIYSNSLAGRYFAKKIK
ncbi:hypothetical protein [Flavobacterium sp.]|uniref:hypothetical protein n=1 Tax=Flavobacterium sp. TaxID=239 RepID=UPI0037526238